MKERSEEDVVWREGQRVEWKNYWKKDRLGGDDNNTI